MTTNMQIERTIVRCFKGITWRPLKRLSASHEKISDVFRSMVERGLLQKRRGGGYRLKN